MDSDKMADEKFEHRKRSTVEEGFGDVDESLVKKVLWKMDVRYVASTFAKIVPMLMLTGYCLSWHSCSCALSSIAQMLEMVRKKYMHAVVLN